MDELKEQIASGYENVRQRIMWAAERAGRNPAETTVVAVTKTWSAEVVVAGYEVGLRHFGENRAGELEEKRAEVEEILGPESGIVWHLIGPLQSRKTQMAADAADYFHALDRLKIARRLSRHLQESGRTLPVLLQVNVSGEESKHGFDATRWEEDEAQRATLRQLATEIASKPGLAVHGLMTMAPWQVEKEVIAAVFRRTHALSVWLEEVVPEARWHTLSMGMTDDFELAVEYGATYLRIGRAIFGERE